MQRLADREKKALESVMTEILSKGSMTLRQGLGKQKKEMGRLRDDLGKGMCWDTPAADCNC